MTPAAQPRTWLVLTALMAAEITSSFETGMIYAALARLYGVFGDPIGVGWLVTQRRRRRGNPRSAAEPRRAA